ncbi:MAG: glycosyltransferase [Cyanobacteria bacterium NC_groundwater_1444_Ag_S-0.65um_54_12]|nr:glycosyltransferase [Cyanobacteria bacterium NC_groundwater_1444_Ag_S-0.65um_54_12]
MKANGTLRVLHCPLMVGGNPQSLARAERALGVESWSVAFRDTFARYPCDEILWQDQEAIWQFEWKRWRLLWRSLWDFDVIHFNFGMSILPHWVPVDSTIFGSAPKSVRHAYQLYARLFELRDLPLLKRAGKGIVVTYQGNDARQGDYCRNHFAISPVTEVDPREYSAESDAHKRWKIRKFASYADRSYALNPDIMHVLPPETAFLPYAHIDLTEWNYQDPDGRIPAVPVVLHAPSHQGMKGTRFVQAAVARLRAEGIPFEYIQLAGLSQAKARELYQQADLLIDQVLCGWYGGLAVELMALGKPVVCYLREPDLRFIPEGMRQDLPLIQAEPSTLYEVLKEWLTMRKSELAKQGRKSREFVEKWHDPKKIARRLLDDYQTILNRLI